MALYRSPEYQTSDTWVGPFLPQDCNLKKSSWYFQWSFESVGLSVQEKRFKIDFQDGYCGGHLGFSIWTILSGFDLQVTLILSIKVCINCLTFPLRICLCWGFMAQSTQWGHVERGRFYLTTCLLGRQSSKRLTSIVHILSPETDNCPLWISGRERMTVENISWSISTKECCRPRRGLNPWPPGLQSDGASNRATETIS